MLAGLSTQEDLLLLDLARRHSHKVEEDTRSRSNDGQHSDPSDIQCKTIGEVRGE